MRVLIITRIFPNAAEPLAAPFNRQQFSALARRCDVEIVAPIPWFPGASAMGRWSRAGRLTGVPRSERISELSVLHPRVAYIPKLARGSYGALYAASLIANVVDYRGRIDAVLGSWAYPDGCAAILLGRVLGVPVVVKTHGTDINVVAEMRGPRRALRRVLPRADRVVAVSRPLRDRIIALGVAPERVDIVNNGVDTTLFRVRDRAQERQALGYSGPRQMVLYVGRLERAKGAVDLVDAFVRYLQRDSDIGLVLVGDGPARVECERAAAALPGRIFVAGAQPLERVAAWLGASDLLALPSYNEGTPNVVLEALASGRRVVATRVGGIVDLLRSPALGRLIDPRHPDELALRLREEARAAYEPNAVAKEARVSDWDDSARSLHASLELAVSARRELARSPTPVLAPAGRF